MEEKPIALPDRSSFTIKGVRSIARLREQRHERVDETADEAFEAVEARLRELWEAEHPGGFEGKGWDEWQQEYERQDADADHPGFNPAWKPGAQ